jgi:hypothetical protein
MYNSSVAYCYLFGEVLLHRDYLQDEILWLRSYHDCYCSELCIQLVDD